MTEKLMKRILSDDGVHAQWLNTLAFLEHVGSRKLIKSQNSQRLDADLLDHIAEETRHAAFLKRLLSKNFPGRCPTFEDRYLLGQPETYFQSLDAEVSGILQREDGEVRRLAYAYVTLLVEVRALDVYACYQAALVESCSPIRLHSILKEEEKHLAAVREILAAHDPRHEKRWLLFREIECKYYQELIEKIKGEIYADLDDGKQTDDLETVHADEGAPAVF